MGIRVREKGHVQGRFAYRFGVMRWNGDKYEIPSMKYFSKKHMELLGPDGKPLPVKKEEFDVAAPEESAEPKEANSLVTRLSAQVREVAQEEGSAV